MVNPCGGVEVRFLRHGSGIRWERQEPLTGNRPRGSTPIGVPSTGLSLGGLLASRARLRFTRCEGDTASGSSQQEQSTMSVKQIGECVAKEGRFSVQRMGST